MPSSSCKLTPSRSLDWRLPAKPSLRTSRTSRVPGYQHDRKGDPMNESSTSFLLAYPPVNCTLRGSESEVFQLMKNSMFNISQNKACQGQGHKLIKKYLANISNMDKYLDRRVDSKYWDYGSNYQLTPVMAGTVEAAQDTLHMLTLHQEN